MAIHATENRKTRSASVYEPKREIDKVFQTETETAQRQLHWPQTAAKRSQEQELKVRPWETPLPALDPPGTILFTGLQAHKATAPANYAKLIKKNTSASNF